MARWILAEIHLESKIPGMIDKLENLDDELYRIGEKVRDAASSMAPVETGALRASISVTTASKTDFNSRVATAKLLRPEASYDTQSSPPKNAVDIHAPVHYATYQELGTMNHGPQPYLIPALSTLDPGIDLFQALFNVTSVVHDFKI